MSAMSNKCVATTAKGTQCSRNASKGNMCSQHVNASLGGPAKKPKQPFVGTKIRTANVSDWNKYPLKQQHAGPFTSDNNEDEEAHYLAERQSGAIKEGRVLKGDYKHPSVAYRRR